MPLLHLLHFKAVNKIVNHKNILKVHLFSVIIHPALALL